MLAAELEHFFTDCPVKDNVDIFNAPLPKEWVEEALNLTQSVSVRRRKLPPEQVLRLVIGMSLMRHEPIQEVATRLAFTSKGLTPNLLAARSSLSNARQRLGVEPVQWLFNQCADHWAKQTHVDDNWHDLQLFAIDGTTLRTEDTPACREHFGSANTSGKFESGYPVMRLTCLMNLRSHLIVRAVAGKYRDSEITQASQMVDNLPDNSVLIMDKLYHSAELLHHIEETGQKRFWVTPLKSDINYSIIQSYAENDHLVERALSSHARKKAPALPKTWQMRLIRYEIEGHPPKLIATNLPHEKYPAQDIIALYHERWQIELGYRDMKKSMLNNAVTLRSKKVGLVYQELYGMLLAYNLVRHEIALTANTVNIRPTRIRFTSALRIVMYDYYGMACSNSLHTLPARMKDLTETLKDFILPKPKRPSYPRAVKIKPCKFPLKRTERLRKKA